MYLPLPTPPTPSTMTCSQFRTGVWLMDKPVMHFIYRFCIFFAPQSSKDWAKGHRFIEYILASGGLQPGERWVLEGLMAIRGSRNGVFWANAVAIVIWRERAIAFLEVCASFSTRLNLDHS